MENIRVLLVEDNADHAELIVGAVSGLKPELNITVVSSVAAARAQALHKPDIVIADLRLPDGRGIDLLKEDVFTCPVLVITSQGDEKAAVEALRAGAHDYLVKSHETFERMHRAVLRALREWEHIRLRECAEAQLRESEKRYRSLIEDSRQLICRFRASGEISFVNGAFAEFFAMGAAKPERLNFFDLFEPSDSHDIRYALFQEPARKEPGDGYTITRLDELQTLPLDGRHRWSDWVLHELGDGAAPEYQAVGIDVTDKMNADRELRENKSRLQSVLNTVDDGVFNLKADGTIDYCNPAGRAIFGYSMEELIGLSFMELLETTPSIDGCATPIETIKTRLKMHENEIVGRHKNGDLRILDMRLRALAENGEFYICVVRDVSDRVRYRNELEFEVERATNRLREALERERQLGKELADALAAEKELNQMKNQFISMVSHEFRTPLAVVQSSADILMNYYERIDAGMREDNFSRIQQEINRMVSLLEDVIFLGHADSRSITVNKAKAHVDTLLRQIVADVSISSDAPARVEQTTEGDDAFSVVDEKLFRIIVGNLLSNGIKYRYPNTPVIIRSANRDGLLRVEVENQGPGISEEKKARLFEPFIRGDNTETIPGTGLGLAIIKKAVDAHGGTIELSEQGETTLFRVVF